MLNPLSFFEFCDKIITQNINLGENMPKGKKKGAVVYVILAIILVIALLLIILALLPKPQNYKGINPLIKHDKLPTLIAHRGGAGEFPGNTLEAFYNAYSVDENVIMETDANITKDGVLILCHETYLDKRTNVSGEIIDWNYSDMMEQKVNFGYDHSEIYKDDNDKEVKPSDLEGYPEGLEGRDKEIYLATTFEDLLVAFPNNIISVELKQSGDLGIRALKEAVRVIEKHNAFDRVILVSFYHNVFKEIQRMSKNGEIPDNVMYPASTVSIVEYLVLYYSGLDVLYGSGICVLQIPMEEFGFNLSSKRFIEIAHKHNIAVQYWTINDESEMRILIENGADGIMTDYPHKLKEVLDSYSK